ncbi:MAG: methylmalonyl-CoA carboxyltransferase [Ectothiorhodospiraceae bacterium]|nr:methylmalonyl-CoA carboxyltransferase [Chromatiales bacterium]MCP5154047.1 methylmalonyl-CoA carboxyltransferase [Ectothiorhodospiraceae bacterium]
MGGPEKLSRRRAQGLLDARARIDALIDPGSFSESGLLARSSVEPADRDRTPADGKVSGYARIDGRPVALVSNDFTVKGASSSLTNMRKIAHVKRTATQRGLPLVLLGESSGARMPDNMGSDGMGALLGNDPHQYVRHRETPWVSALLGDCFGSSAFYACISDHVVMRKGACMAIGSPRLVELAMGEKVDRETLGGHQHHASVTGAVDVVVDDDLAALAEIRRFLSYLPSSASEPPPRAEVPEGADEAASTVGDMLPASRTRGYDMRRLARRLLDPGSAYELKPEFGKTATTMLGRLDGHTVGVIGNNPMFKAGALDPAACAKITRFLAMCDSFNIPIVNLVDTPGFVIGTAAERQNAPTRIMTYMTALQMTTVPKLTVIVRKSYGQAYLNMGGGRNSDEVAAWPSAEVSFMDPRFGARIVSPAGASEETLAEVEEQLGRDSEVWGIAGMFAVQYVLEPGETRQWLVDMLRVHGASTPRAMSRRQLAAWPFNF